MKNFNMKVVHQDKKTHARLGVIHTPHGDIQTPSFVPVGTQATVKSLTPEELNTLGTQLYFVNTYHMYLRPGVEVVKKFGGLQKFMNWNKPLMTDSGGFQVFSLGREASGARNAFFEDARLSDENNNNTISASLNEARLTKVGRNPVGDKQSGFSASQNDNAHLTNKLVKITDEGVEFRSHWDGSKHVFTPETSMGWQWDLGADIHIAFDDCTPYPVTHEQAKASLARTHRWAVRSLAAHKVLSSKFTVHGKNKERFAVNREPITENYQALYGSIQGSVFGDLREDSAKFISGMDFDGFAIGGVSVGESKKEMTDAVVSVIPYLPENKPRHLLGVGEIDDIFMLVENGIDTFDCVQPTRLARVGILFIGDKQRDARGQSINKQHEMDITKAVFAGDTNPIDEGCGCYTCQHFSRAYVHHLFHVCELLGYRLATIHNIFFVQSLVARIRESIQTNSFLELKRKWL